MTRVSLNEYMERCRREIVERCTGCGNCVAHCEIRPYTTLKDIDPVRLVESLRRYLEAGEFEQAVYDHAFQCINCLECTTHCPEGLEASAIPVLAKAKLVESGHDAPPLLKMAQPCQTHSYQNILGAMQTRPSDVWWLEAVPKDAEPHEIVLFLGCHEMIFPHVMTATRDILAALEMDFVSVGGGKNLCCGAVHLNTADPATAHDMGRSLVESLERFRPKTVILTCPTCVYMIRKTVSHESGASSVRYVHLSQFLAERLHTILFVKPLFGRFTVQDPCFTGRGLGDYDTPRAVLSAIKGIELVEMKHNREHALCCGASALGNPEVGQPFIRNRLQEAHDAGADTVVNLCAGCQLAFFGREKDFRLESRTFSEVVAEAMGIKIEQDRMKHFRDLGSPDLILESVREEIEASPYSADDIAMLLPILF
ncbi:(Fe-S)-binding protein [Candidatus Poribacteria bacterium]|nr:(Fe-S)-binding protein [Candidatus Poribacteria bacterium]